MPEILDLQASIPIILLVSKIPDNEKQYKLSNNHLATSVHRLTPPNDIPPGW